MAGSAGGRVDGTAGHAPGRPPAARVFWRALRLRCPLCGGRPIFLTWSRLVPNCPVCGLGLERGEEGYWLGAYLFNLAAVEIAFTAWVVAFFALTLPSPPWAVFQWGTIGLMIAVPVGFFPWSKTLFLAFDVLLRPPTEEDFAAPHEEARRLRRG